MKIPALLIATLFIGFDAGQSLAATLVGFASLPADSLMPGPDSGQFIGATQGVDHPFPGQPAQGFSALIQDGDDGFLALSDNGYGARSNSADYLLRIYFIEPDFRTSRGGSGEIRINGFINLADPAEHTHFRITADSPLLNEVAHDSVVGDGPGLAVHSTLRTDRLLTGADLDPESLQRAPDGSFWVGDEFGPFIAHLDARGVLIEALFSLSGLHAAASPDGRAGEVTLPVSRGFEGMAISPSGQYLFPMLEGSLTKQAGQLNIYTFDLEKKTFINATALEPSYRYQPQPEATAVGAFTLFSASAGLVLERDSGAGPTARHKKVYRVDFDRIDARGFLVKQEVADLMAIQDPDDLDQDGRTLFSFGFKTPESLVVLDKNTIGIINDNNYPFGRGRGPGDSPERSEFILLRIADLW